MTTNSVNSSEFVCDSSVLMDRSMPSEASTIDMNHNNWQKCARKLSFLDETTSNGSQHSSQSSASDQLNEENPQKASQHEQQTQPSKNRMSYTKLSLLKLGNVCQSSRKSRQPVLVLDQTTMKHKIRVIDYSSWQWQPDIPLKKLTDDELKDVDRSLLTQNQSEYHPVHTIKFDRDEELIRELSPDTAAERFQKQLEEIKKLSDEPSQPRANSSSYKSAKKIRNKPCPEIDELDKRFRDIQPSQGKHVARKLYNHERMVKKTIGKKENIESPKVKAKAHLVQSQRPGKQMPMRLAKNTNISYVY